MVETGLVLTVVGVGALAALTVVGIWLTERILSGESDTEGGGEPERLESGASATRDADEAEPVETEEADRVETDEAEPVETDESHA